MRNDDHRRVLMKNENTIFLLHGHVGEIFCSENIVGPIRSNLDENGVSNRPHF